MLILPVFIFRALRLLVFLQLSLSTHCLSNLTRKPGPAIPAKSLRGFQGLPESPAFAADPWALTPLPPSWDSTLNSSPLCLPARCAPLAELCSFLCPETPPALSPCPVMTIAHGFSAPAWWWHCWRGVCALPGSAPGRAHSRHFGHLGSRHRWSCFSPK